MSDDATRTAVANTINMMLAIQPHVADAIRGVRTATDPLRKTFGLTTAERDTLLLMAIEQRLLAATQALSDAANE